MALPSGARLGVYEITAPIGAGGMGEVYRATDTKLKRQVAIKILPPSVAADHDRLARFQREAEVLASLNDPHIAGIHGLEESGGVSALVMELVEGEDLSDRLARGAMPIEEALPIATQIAEALEAAHDQGIIHRDLKPANVKVRPDGTVKVLDFGLAKALDGAGRTIGAGREELPTSPTITSPAMTMRGVILGTAAYMSPEQARGKPVDRRADIWAFGCVLYEMLTSRRAFGGDDMSLTLAAVLKEEVDFAALPAETPTSIRRLLQRCFQKDPRKRLSAIADARFELDEATGPQGTAHPVPVPLPRSRWLSPAMVAVSAVAGGLATFGLLTTIGPRQTVTMPVVRSELALPLPITVSNTRAFVLNPSGTEIVFAAANEGEASRLFRRRLSDDQALPITGTDNASGPFFSPDGQWLGFYQSGRLKKMPAGGGAVIDLGDGGFQGGGFLPDGSVLFNLGHGEGLFRTTGSGTERTVITSVANDKGEAGHHWPQILPGGRHVLFTTELAGKPYSEARIELLTLATGERRVLIEGGTDARYATSGHLLYWREGEVWRAPFDLTRLEVTGAAISVLKNVTAIQANGHALFSVADNGTLAYVTGPDPVEEHSLVLVDRTGKARQLTSGHRAFTTVAISADGRRLATTIVAANDSIWTMEIGRAALTRITFDAETSDPVWSPDGSQLAITRHVGGEAMRPFLLPADGSRPPELLRDPGGVPEQPRSWNRTGTLALVRTEPTGPDIWVMPMEGDRKARPFLATRFDEAYPRFSPDGKWIAYASNESGDFEIYLRPFPGPGPSRLVSNDGGVEPRWRGDGREIFYRNGDEFLAVDVALGATPTFSLPRVLFKGSYFRSDWSGWDVMPDGQGFVVIQTFGQPRTSVSLVQNWFEELKQP